MASVDKAAIAWSIGIVAAFMGVAFAAQGMQEAGQPLTPPVATPTESMPTETPSEKETMMMDESVIQGVNADMQMSGTIASIQDPGLGHESHQLAILLPPSEKTFSGTLKYDASEPIQLVSLRGPIGPTDFATQIWTPDGETKFALTLVDPKNSKGSWEFSGNALAIHTMFPDQFTADFTIELDSEQAMDDSGMEEEVSMEEEVMVSEPTVEPVAEPEPAGPQTVSVSMPAGTSVPGCEETDACYIPSSVSINAGDTVSWSNDDTAAHTVTSGSPTGGPDGVFDSSLVMAGATFEHTFDDAGSYDYFCMVHPWMKGSVQVS